LADGWYGYKDTSGGLGATHKIRVMGGSGLITTVLSCGGGGFSDRRLKENIKLIGVSPKGINIYSFNYIDKRMGEGTWQGALADELEYLNDGTVYVNQSEGIGVGYKMIDYNMIDVEFKQI
jgi:hypothetical protein